MSSFTRAIAITGLLLAGFCVAVALAFDLPGAYREWRDSPKIVVSIEPLRMILQEILPEGTPVHVLIPPDESPHTYEFSRRQLRAIRAADLYLGVSARNEVDQKEIDRVTLERKGLCEFAIVAAPASQGLEQAVESSCMRCARLAGMADEVGHQSEFKLYFNDYGDGCSSPYDDSHFWMDPITIADMLEPLAAHIESHGVQTDPIRLEAFRQELLAFDAELEKKLAPLKGKFIVEHHSSMIPFFRRYGMGWGYRVRYSFVIEPTEQYIERAATQHHIVAVAREPQIDEDLPRILAEKSGKPLITLDPIGGVPGRMTYRELILFNANALASVAP